ncbi:MAG: methylmalonyl-CoA mutase family protein [Pseudomonadota bacterium]
MAKDNIFEKFKRAYDAWKAEDLDPAIKRYGERIKRFETRSEIPVKALYTPLDMEGFDYLEKLNFPGRYPFTRGSYAEGYRTRTWFVRALFGYGTAEETNQRMKFLIDQGATGLNIVYDAPTGWEGIDADNPLAMGEVGKNGVTVNTLKDMEDMFEGLPIEKMNVTWAACVGASNIPLTAMYIAMAQKRGLDISKLNGAAINDVFVGYALNVCSLPYTHPRDALKDWCDAVEHAILCMPNWFPCSIASYEMGESGATPVQQIAFTIAAAISYTRALMERGLKPDQIAPKYAIFLSCGNNFLEEVAKYRALRRMWARTFRERFGVQSKRGLQSRIHTQTSGLTLRAEQPLNNIVRTTCQSLSAIFGGTNSLYTDPFDEVLGLPSEESHRLALRTQQIIIEETGVADTIDPLAGSYYVESLTDKIEGEAWKIVDKVEEMGGMLAAIENRYFRSIIDETYHRYLKAVDNNEKVIVGYNKYRQEEELPIGVFEVPEEIEEKQKRRLRKVKEGRDSQAVERALGKIAVVSERGENVMDACIEAAKVYATHEEIIKAICRPRESYSEQYRIMSSKF